MNEIQQGKKTTGDKFPELRKDRSHKIEGNNKVPNRMTLRRLILSDNLMGFQITEDNMKIKNGHQERTGYLQR